MPILVDETGEIIAGHARLLAAEANSFKSYPVVVARDWTEAQKRSARLRDNQRGLMSSWDVTLIKCEIADLKLLQYDMPLLSFPESQLRGWGISYGPESKQDPEAVPDRPKKPVVRKGDLWILGDHRLLCGNAMAVSDMAKCFGGIKPKLLVTSPPYNQKIDGFKPSGMHKEGDWVKKVGTLAYSDDVPEDEYQKQQCALLAAWYSALPDGASIFYNHKNRYREKRVISPLAWILSSPFVLRQEIIWSRPGSITQNARMFLPSDERIYWLYKGNDFTFNDDTDIKTWSSVWNISPVANLDHAVAFPVEIPRRAIIAVSTTSDRIFDPFVGSGTTIIAAEMTGRKALAIEIDPGCVQISIERWQTFTGKKATLDGQTLEEVAKARKRKGNGAAT